MFRKCLTGFALLSALLVPGRSTATHLMGGSLDYVYLGFDSLTGNYRYQVTINIYRLCDPGSSLLPVSMNLGVYQDNPGNPSGPKQLVLNTVLPITSQQNITPPNANDSCTFTPNVCVEEGIYQAIVAVPPNTTGYYFISDLCCRNNNIANLNVPGNTGQAYYAKAPAPATVNSSPTFAVVPVPFICANDTISYLNQAFDPDGDLLVYNFVVPYSGIATGGNPTPNPPVNYPWPIATVAYAPTYNVNFPFGPGGYAAINPNTGLTQYFAPNQGYFVLAVEISEYRNGILIGSTRRDIQIIVITCPPNPAPNLSATTPQTSYTIDEGDSLCFNTTFTDPNGDSLFITHVGDIFDIGITNPVALFVDSSGAGTATGQFCWYTGCDQGDAVPYNFSVIATDNGCPAKITNIVYTITVINTPAPGPVTGPDTLCLNAAAGLTYSVPTDTGYTHHWFITGGSINGSTTGDTVNVDLTGPGSVFLSVYNENKNGCLSDTTTKEIVLNGLPAANAGTDVTYCSGASVNIGAAALPGYTYQWSPSSGLSSDTVANPLVTLTNATGAPIVVTYVLTADLGGCIATDTVEVTVNPLPGPAAGPDVALCSGDSVSIGLPNVPGSTYSWNPGTGLNDSTLANPTVILLDTTGVSDTLTYVVLVQNVYGCSTTDTVQVILHPVPVAAAGANVVFCSGASASLGAAPTGGYTYSWSPATGLSSSTTSNPTVTLTTPGPQNDTLFYVLTATLGPCTDQDTVRVVVKPAPVAVAGANQVVCAGQTVQLGAASTPGYVYSWSPATGLSDPSVSDPLLTLNNMGSQPDTLLYVVTVTLNGCTSTDTVQVISAPAAVAVAGADTVFCSGASAPLGAAPVGGYTYSWSPATGLSSATSANPTVTLINTGPQNDTLLYIVTATLGPCTGQDTVQVIVKPSPAANAGPNQLLCAGQTVQLGTGTTPGYIYSWSPGTGLNDPSLSDPILTLNNMGTQPDTLYYVVTVTLNGCTSTDSVQIISGPAPTAVAGPDTVYCSGTTVVLGSAAQPNYNYSWSPAAGLSSGTVSNPTVTHVNTSGVDDTLVYVLTTTLFGCAGSDTVVVVVKPSPVSDAGPDTTLCGGDTFVIGTSSTPGYLYNWNPGSGLSGTTVSNPTLTVNNTGGGPVTLTYTVTTELNGCFTSDSVTITVNPQPVVAASAGPAAICAGDSAVLTASGATSYNWALASNPGTSIGTSPTLTVSPAVTTTYLLNGSYSTGCENDDSITVTVYPLPAVQVSAPNDTLCDGDTLTLTASGASTYSWSVSGGGVIGTGSSIQVNPSTATTYVVTGTDANGCVNTDSITVTVNPAPTLASLNGTLSVCPGVTGVLYWVNNPNPNSTYQWTVNNGTIASGQGTDTIAVDWSVTPGSGSVTVVEITDLGCASEPVTLPVTINVLLTPVAPAGPDTLCANEAQGILYNTLNTPGSTYIWFAQGGSVVGGNGTATVTVDWSVTGPQLVYLWYEETSITAVDTCFGTSDTLAVYIVPIPATGAISGPSGICVSDTGSFSVVNTSGSTYSWSISGGTILAGNGTNTVTASWTGSGTATLYVVENSSVTGCTGDTVSFTVTVFALPAANAGPDTDVCIGQSVQLNASGGVTYQWTPSTGLSNPNIPDPLASPSATTTYTVLVTDTNGCRNTDEVQVTVNPLPVITLTPNSAICINGSIQLNASGGTQYLWAPAGSLSNATISNPVASPTVTTTYTVTVTDGNGCVDSAGVTITVNPLPTVTVSADTIICAGSSVTLTASGGVSYSWTPASSLSNANVSNPVATPSSPTTYTVTVTDANGCTNDGQVTVDLNAQPQASFTVDDANLAAATCLGYDGRLINTSVDALGYQWIFANGSTSTDPEPIVHFNLTGSNLITLVAINNFCRDTAVVDFTSTAVAQVFANMPNVITPNGDGNNDCYKFGNTIDLKECSQWKVFNRWGNEVFSASPAQPCWNGKKDNTGADLPVGTYFVVVVIEDQSYKGTITLIR